MMRTGLCVVLLAASFVLSANVRAAPEPSDGQNVSYGGVTFPAQLGDARRESAAAGGRGFEAVYAHDSTKTTIAVYPASHGIGLDDARASIVRREFNSHRQIVLQARGAGTDVKIGREFTLADARKVPRLICQSFVIAHGHMVGPQTDRLLDYYICTGAVNGQFMWTHTMLGHWPDPEPVMRRFLHAWIDHIWK